jgi:hypothetical protein
MRLLLRLAHKLILEKWLETWAQSLMKKGPLHGKMAEWSNAGACKALTQTSGVRIPLLPPRISYYTVDEREVLWWHAPR